MTQVECEAKSPIRLDTLSNTESEANAIQRTFRRVLAERDKIIQDLMAKLQTIKREPEERVKQIGTTSKDGFGLDEAENLKNDEIQVKTQEMYQEYLSSVSEWCCKFVLEELSSVINILSNKPMETRSECCNFLISSKTWDAFEKKREKLLDEIKDLRESSQSERIKCEDSFTGSNIEEKLQSFCRIPVYSVKPNKNLLKYQSAMAKQVDVMKSELKQRETQVIEFCSQLEKKEIQILEMKQKHEEMEKSMNLQTAKMQLKFTEIGKLLEVLRMKSFGEKLDLMQIKSSLISLVKNSQTSCREMLNLKQSAKYNSENLQRRDVDQQIMDYNIQCAIGESMKHSTQLFFDTARWTKMIQHLTDKNLNQGITNEVNTNGLIATYQSKIKEMRQSYEKFVQSNSLKFGEIQDKYNRSEKEKIALYSEIEFLKKQVPPTTEAIDVISQLRISLVQVRNELEEYKPLLLEMMMKYKFDLKMFYSIYNSEMNTKCEKLRVMLSDYSTWDRVQTSFAEFQCLKKVFYHYICSRDETLIQMMCELLGFTRDETDHVILCSKIKK